MTICCNPWFCLSCTSNVNVALASVWISKGQGAKDWRKKHIIDSNCVLAAESGSWWGDWLHKGGLCKGISRSAEILCNCGPCGWWHWTQELWPAYRRWYLCSYQVRDKLFLAYNNCSRGLSETSNSPNCTASAYCRICWCHGVRMSRMSWYGPKEGVPWHTLRHLIVPKGLRHEWQTDSIWFFFSSRHWQVEQQCICVHMLIATICQCFSKGFNSNLQILSWPRRNYGTDQARVEAGKKWTGRRYTFTVAKQSRKDLQIIADLIAKGKLKIEIAEIISLEEAVWAFPLLSTFWRKEPNPKCIAKQSNIHDRHKRKWRVEASLQIIRTWNTQQKCLRSHMGNSSCLLDTRRLEGIQCLQHFLTYSDLDVLAVVELCWFDGWSQLNTMSANAVEIC